MHPNIFSYLIISESIQLVSLEHLKYNMSNKPGAKAGPSGGQMQTIDLTKLNLMQLTQFKNQMDQDLQFYQESLQNLKHAQTR